ncbi:unnamed protein product [Microthlaspi erraticum]|uniref:Uncharacterized protein n=1 Tax=Microthlaspi erraticum TaxID=1685480 RepID=A0A6D2HEY4_9BRAS|nr:unnamed protein product [Microthlaspi erraticum]
MASSLPATQYLSLDLMMEACEFLFGLTHDIIDIIIEINEDVGETKDQRSLVSSLVDLYLKSTTATLNLFNTVENLVERAKTRQHIIRNAVKQFEAEDTDVGGSKKKKYAKTLEELNKFEATGDPLGEEFFPVYKSVVDQQIKLLEHLCEQKLNLDKKLKKANILKKISYVVLGAAASVVIVIALISPLAPQMGRMAQIWHRPKAATRVSVSEMLAKYENNVKTYKALLISAEKSMEVNKEATETINSQVKNLTGKLSYILEQVDFAVEREEEEEATRLAMQEIMTNVEEFTKKIEEVGEYAATSSKLIVSRNIM